MTPVALRFRQAEATTPLRGELRGLWRALRALFDPYRPERHYMRGPGPRWHAKHAAGGVSTATPAQAPARVAAPSLVPVDTVAFSR